MRILITSGGTTEPIDSVRGITNHSTGKLGKEVAHAFLEQGDEVTLITTKHAVKPDPWRNLTLIEIHSTLDLEAEMKHQLTSSAYDAVIHSMAVSDYRVDYVADLEAFKQDLANSNVEELSTPAVSSKISSNAPALILKLVQTPKIIREIKKWQPSSTLVAFKLLVDVSKEHLLNIANESIQKNQADFVLANDLNEISGENHHAYLLSSNGEYWEAETKKEIAQLIVEKIGNQKTKG